MGHRVGCLGGDRHRHADAHVEDLITLRFADRIVGGEDLEQSRHLPGTLVDHHIVLGRQRAGDVVHKAAAGDVSECFDGWCLLGAVELLEQSLHQGPVADVNLEECVADGAPQFGHFGSRLQLHVLEEDFAGQRVAVGVQSAGGDAEDDVALPHRLLTVQHAGLFDDADDGAAEVVLAALVEAGHLGGLAADEGAVVETAAADEALDDVFEDVRLQLPGTEVIEEEQGFRAEHGDVVDAVVDQVLADGVVAVEGEGDLELGADAVHGGHHDGLLVALGVEGEQAAEAADLAQDLAAVGRSEQGG